MNPLSKKECPDAVKRIIDFYNNERPHMRIWYQTPSEAHLQSRKTGIKMTISA